MGPASVRPDARPAIRLAMASSGKARAFQPFEIFCRFAFCGLEFSCPGSRGVAHGSFAKLVESLLLSQRGRRNVSESGGIERNDQARARAGCRIRDGGLVFIPKYRRLDGRSGGFALRVNAIAQIIRHQRRCPNNRGGDFGIADQANQTPDVRGLVANKFNYAECGLRN